MIQTDSVGRKYTNDKYEVEHYKIRDRQLNFHAIKHGYTPQPKYVKMYTEVETANGKFYVLPISEHRVEKEYRLTEYIDVNMGEIRPYDYQDKAVNFVKGVYTSGKKSALIVSSMGT